VYFVAILIHRVAPYAGNGAPSGLDGFSENCKESQQNNHGMEKLFVGELPFWAVQIITSFANKHHETFLPTKSTHEMFLWNKLKYFYPPNVHPPNVPMEQIKTFLLFEKIVKREFYCLFDL
jgi:hypothetical protein